MSGSDLTDEDKRAWRAVTRHIKPLRGRAAAVPHERKAPAPKDQGAVARPEAKARTSLPPLENRDNDRRVRRGQQTIDGRLDLHGHTQTSAWEAVPRFLFQKRSQGARCVIIITGKGVGGNGILRRNFLQWLELPQARHLISGYSPAHPKHGGGGAFYVYLRR